MKPVFQIKAGNSDITSQINKRLLSLRVTDESGIQSDSLEIKLDDRGRNLTLPPSGKELSLYLGYEDSPLERMGIFTVDEITLEGMADTLTIRARAADFKRSLKAQKTRSWHNVTLGTIAETIASEHELNSTITDALKGQVIDHIDQTEESDLHFLTRLAKKYDAISTIKSSNLMVTQSGAGRSQSGREFDDLNVSIEDVSQYRFTMADRGNYVAAIAHWHNNESGEREPVRVGDTTGEPAFTLRGLHPDAKAAKIAARSKLQSLRRGTQTGEITLPGNLLFRAEAKVTLKGFRNEIDEDWVITRAEHTLTRQGLMTSASLESPSDA